MTLQRSGVIESLVVKLYLGGGQEDMLWGFLISSQRVSLTPVDEVKGHSLLLFNERLLLSMRLKQKNTVLVVSDDITGKSLH